MRSILNILLFTVTALYLNAAVTVTLTPGTTTFDPEVGTTITFGTVNEVCDLGAYTATISTLNGLSSNSFFFKAVDPANSREIPYTITYGGVAIDPLSPTIARGSATSLAGVDYVIEVTYSGQSDLYSDTYSDDITVTIDYP